MEFTGPKETLPVVRKEAGVPMLSMKVVSGVCYMKLIAVIPPKVSDCHRSVDPEDLGNSVDVYV